MTYSLFQWLRESSSRSNSPRRVTPYRTKRTFAAAKLALWRTPSATADAPSLCSSAMRFLAGALVLSLALFGVVGCSASSSSSDDADAQPGDGAIVVDIDGMDLSYTDRDKDASYDESSATKVTLAGTTARVEGEGASVDGSTVTISAEGTYVVSGTLSQGQLVVDLPGSSDKAQVVLSGASIRNANGPALYVKQADKAFITLADGTKNQLSDGADYQLEADSDEPYATLFSKDDLTINGSGALEVAASYRHGICSKDDLVITGGAITVSAPEDALRGRDCVKVLDGTFDLTSGEDAIKSNKDTDGTLGFVCIDGGTFAISAGDDAIHGETAVIANGGNVTVSACAEGYEAQQVHVNGGEHSIASSDDAINASAIGSGSGSTSSAAADPTGADSTGEKARGKGAPGGGAMPSISDDCLVRIAGGTIWLNAEGDVIDSNGSIEVAGGTVTGCGPSSSDDAPMDYETGASVTGGTVLIVGSSMMAEGFTQAEQPFALVDATGAAGSEVELRGPDGTVLASLAAERAFQCALATAPGLAADAAASLSIDGAAVEFTPSLEAQAAGMRAGKGGAAASNGQQPGSAEGAQPGAEGSEPPTPPDGEAADGQRPQRPQDAGRPGSMRGEGADAGSGTAA